MDCSLLGSSIHGIFQARGKNTDVGCHFLLPGIFLTQGSNSISGRLLTFWATRSSSCDGRVSQGCFILRPTSSQGATLKEGLYAVSGLRVGPSTGSWRKERSLNKIWLIFFPVDQWGQNSSAFHLWGKEWIFLCGSVTDKPRRHLI